MMLEINLVAVIIASVANMALGYLWYSPTLFGKEWIQLMGYTKESLEKTKAKLISCRVLSGVSKAKSIYLPCQTR